MECNHQKCADEHTNVSHNLNIYAYAEHRSRQKRQQRKLSYFEEEMTRGAFCSLACDCLQSPVLLRASNGQKARNFVVPPRQPDEHYPIELLHRQLIQMSVFHLTTSEEVPVNLVHYEIAGVCHYSTKVFIVSSPIFTVHYERCPPNDKIEEFTNPCLRNVSDLILRPSTHLTGEIMHMNWRNVKLATAYGIHSAVQRVIVTEKIRNVRRLKAQKQQPRTHGFDEFLPSSDVCKTILLTAPKKQTLKLCTSNDTDKEPRKVAEIIIEEQFYDAVETCEISVSSLHITKQ